MGRVSNIVEKLADKKTFVQILGTLAQNPSILSETGKYSITKEDFSDNFYYVIYSTIYNLSLRGVVKINSFDIDSYLKDFPVPHKIFTTNNGIDFVEDCINVAEPMNFDYYYDRMKKFSLLRKLTRDGFNVDFLYSTADDLDFKKVNEINEQFDQMKLEDIVLKFQQKLSLIEKEYIGNSNANRITADEGARALLDQLKRTPEIGMPLQGHIFNTATRGARITKFYIRSGATGSGKSRTQIGDACYMAFPIRYNQKKKQWVHEGSEEKILYITTEMEPEEVQTIQWAYLTDINEEKILNMTLDIEEVNRVEQAIQIIEHYAPTNFFIEHMPDHTIAQLTASIRNYVLNHGVKYVFFDYIFSTAGLLNEYLRFGLREDVILGMLSSALKDLCNELDIFILSGTQLNEKWRTELGPKDQNCLRGSKAIADKADMGCIILPATKEDKDQIMHLVNQLNCPMEPNTVTDIYKNRRSRHNHIRIWSYLDLGTGRMTDLFATDAYWKYWDSDYIETIFDNDLDFDLDNLNKEVIIYQEHKGTNYGIDMSTGEIVESLVVDEKEGGWSY